MDTKTVNIILQAQDNASKKIQSISNNVDKFAESTDRLANKLSNVGNKMSVFVTAPLALAGRQALKSATQYEQLDVAMGTMLGSAEQAKDLLNELDALAVKTPFQIDEVQNAAKQLIAYGVEQEKIIDTTRVMGDVSAGLGGGDTFGRLVYAFGQIKARGQLMGSELRQLTETGFNLADAMGVTHGELADMMDSADGVSFDQVNQAFISATSEGGRYHQMMDKLSETTGGKISNMQDEITRSMRQIGTDMLPTAEKVVGAVKMMIEWYSKLGAETKNYILIATAVVAAIGPVARALSLVLKSAKAVASGIKIAGKMAKASWSVVKFATKWAVQFAKILAKAVVTTAKLVAQAVKAAAGWIAQAVLVGAAWLFQFTMILGRTILVGIAMVGQALLVGAAWVAQAIAVGIAWVVAMWPVMLAIAAVAAAAFIVIKNWDTLKKWFGAFWEFLKGAFSAAIEFIKKNWDKLLVIILGPLGLLIVAIVKNFDRIKSFVGGVFSGIRSAASSAWNFIKGIWNGAFSFFSSIGNGIKNGISAGIEGAKGIVKGGINFVIDKVNSVIRGINNTAGRVPGVPDIPQIPRLQKGTNFFGGGLAVVGERGPEVVAMPRGSRVITNSQSGDFLKDQGGGKTVNVTNNIYNQVDMDMVIKDIGWRLAT